MIHHTTQDVRPSLESLLTVYRCNHRPTLHGYPSQWLHTPQHRPHVPAPLLTWPPHCNPRHPLQSNHHPAFPHLPQIPLPHQRTSLSRNHRPALGFLPLQPNRSRPDRTRACPNSQLNPCHTATMSFSHPQPPGVPGARTYRR